MQDLMSDVNDNDSERVNNNDKVIPSPVEVCSSLVSVELNVDESTMTEVQDVIMATHVQTHTHTIHTNEDENVDGLEDCFINFHETGEVLKNNNQCRQDYMPCFAHPPDEEYVQQNSAIQTSSLATVFASAMNTVYQDDCEPNVEDADLLENLIVNHDEHLMEHESNSEYARNTEEIVSETSKRRFRKITNDDCEEMMNALRQNKDAENIHGWSTFSIGDFQRLFKSKTACNKNFRKFELEICIKILKLRYDDILPGYQKALTKPKLVASFVELQFEDIENNIHTLRKNVKRRKAIKSLRQLCSDCLDNEPKENLAKILAENTWRKVLSKWLSAGPIKNGIDIENIQDNMQWFSQPAIDKDGKVRYHFTDACHILTCLRTKLCTTGIQGLKRKAWEIAALSPYTSLNISLILDCVDKQDVALARRVFAEDVQEQMTEEYHEEAKFCQLIREWFDAEDEPGLTARQRCQSRLALRKWLLDGYHINVFPPPTRYVKGIPIQTYETLLTHIERKIQIYSFCPGQTYNARAISSQQVENFFSAFRDLDSTGKGTPKPDSIPKIMKAVAEIERFRVDPNRYFLICFICII